MNLDIKKGYVLPSGNFEITDRISSLDELYEYLINSPLLFARHKIYSSSFIMNWQIRTVKIWLDRGHFHKTKRLKK